MKHKINRLKQKDGLSRENWDLLLQLEQSLQKPSFSYTTNSYATAFLTEIEDLFTLMALVYYERDEKQITFALQNISCLAKHCLLKQLLLLRLSSGKTTLIQSLFATIYELAGTPWIQLPTSQDIDIFFEERKETLLSEESRRSSIFYLKRPA